MVRLFCSAALALVVSSVALAQEVRIHDRAFVVTDPKANQVRFQMLVQAGCADEADNICKGIAHYLEHLVLVGRNAQNTDQNAMRFFADGDSNGWTNSRVTGFVHGFPAKAADLDARLDKLFGFYAARLNDFGITPADAERERNVVRQERDWRLGSNPYIGGMIATNDFLFAGRPLPLWPGGTPEQIAAFSIEDAKAFHSRWYGINNVTFIISGPLEPEALKPYVEKHLGGLQPKLIPARPWLTDATLLTPDAKDFSFADRRISAPSVVVAKAVNFTETDPVKTLATINLVNAYLRSKIAGSPHSVLVEQKELALSASAYLTRTSGTLMTMQIAVDNDSDASPQAVLAAAKAYRDDFLSTRFDEKTLERLKKRFRQSYARELADKGQAAQRLINWLSIPLPPERLKELPQAVEQVSLDDVAALFAALRAPGREASTTYLPKTE